MKRMRPVALVFGTRPEAIKMCPVVLSLRERARVPAQVCVTGQHREMLAQVLGAFEVTPDVDLAVMEREQTLAALSARLLVAIDGFLATHAPGVLLVQGDTTTALCAALAAFYRGIPVAHLEAGLRSGSLSAPFPEEANRTIISRVASRHFAPTASARANLLREGIPDERIEVTGNTVIDALFLAVRRAVRIAPPVPGVSEEVLGARGGPLVLVTAHRRESFGPGLEAVCASVRRLAGRFPAATFVYPVHLNPSVHEPVHRLLGGIPNVRLVLPLDYLPFVRLLSRADLVLTDSGGLQEEAPALRKPVLVLRDTTERPEVLEAGVAKLVGTSVDGIVEAATTLLTDRAAYDAMARGALPYGDGTAAPRVARACEEMARGAAT